MEGMIEIAKGNLLDADAEALVNTVNTVGVMGKGIALQFRKAYPAVYDAYKRACDQGTLVPGRMLVAQTGQVTGPRLIINFPTKRHWRAKSRLEDIDAGLRDLVRVLREWEVRSVAVPPLGCGNGGLEWDVVKPRIESALADLPDTRVLLFEPNGAPAAAEQRVATSRPRMTKGRASLLAVLDAYQTDPSVPVTLLVVQKLAYLLQATGEPMKLAFVKGKYGPYAETINHVLQRMEGHFVTGYGDRTTCAQLGLDPDAVQEAGSFLAHDAETLGRVTRVQDLIDGFESPFGLELLTTVHWAAHDGDAGDAEAATHFVAQWNARKSQVFKSEYIRVAWNRLEEQGWLDAAGGLPRGATTA